jgi:hypothetical protein
MNARTYRPRRSLRIEVVQLAASMALPAAILYVFPYNALAPVQPTAPREAKSAARCAFVTLDQDQERRVMAAAKSAWQVSAEGVRRLRLDMFAEEIPDAMPGPVAEISTRTRTARSAPVPRFASEPPTDLRAPQPGTIPPERDGPAPRPAFAREELLRLDWTDFERTRQ